MNAKERNDAVELDQELKEKKKARLEKGPAGIPEPSEGAVRVEPAEPNVFGAAYRKFMKAIKMAIRPSR